MKISLFKKKKNSLGVDIGTFSIKIVELEHPNSKKGKAVLKNYGEKINEIEKEDLYKHSRKKVFPLPHKDIADNIKSILIESGIDGKNASFSIPDFMTFFTVFETPPMPKEEIAATIQFEAKQHIPLPLREVALDWSIIEESKDVKIEGWKILLVAVPKKAITEYQQVAELAGINLVSIEAEVFSLARSAILEEDFDKIVQLIDVGVQSTTISIVKNGKIKSTYSIDFSESEIARNLASQLGISYNEVDQMRRKIGFTQDSNEGRILCGQLDILIDEAKQVADNFFKNEKKEVEKIILASGMAMSPGIKEYLNLKTKKKIQTVNPFSGLSYPAFLEETLREIGPRYAIATGLALRDIK